MRRLWAVARTTLKEAVRTRTVAVILVVLLLVVGLGPFLLHGTGKLTDQVQLVLSYAMGAIGFLLSILTIFLSTSTLAGDLREHRIETIATKPIARWQILAGKWLAVMLLNFVLLVVSVSATYALVRFVVAKPSMKGLNEAEKQDAEFEKEQLKDEVFTARQVIEPNRPADEIERDIDAEIPEAKRRVEEEAGETFNEALYRRRRRQELWVSRNTLPPGELRQHVFEYTVPAQPGQTLYIRYKLVSVGQSDGGTAKDKLWVGWVISADAILPPTSGVAFDATIIKLGDYQSVEIPADAFPKAEKLYVTCYNLSNYPGYEPRNVYAAFPTEEGIQLLYRAGTFEMNFIRTCLLLLVRLAFLAALGVAASSVLSFPVASMLVMFVFICALMVDSFLSLASPIGGGEDSPVYQTPAFHRMTLKAIAAVVPNFGRYDGAGNLATGRLVPWRLVVWGAIVVFVLYGGVVMLLGGLYFQNRELADVE